MPSLNVSARLNLVPGLLAALACGLMTAGAHAAPIPTQITYSTTGPEPLKTSAGDVVFDFRPVSDSVATPGSMLRLGTILVHQTPPGKGFSFDNAILPISFTLKSVNGEAIVDPDATISFNNLVSANVYKDGKVMGGLTQFHEYNGPEVLHGGGLALSLKPIQSVPLWNISSDSTIVAVDVYARLEGSPVPEPSVLLIFASAAGLGWKRHRCLKTRRP